MKLSNFPCEEYRQLKALGSWPAAGHYYDTSQMKAIVAAWHAGRPLLVRGEPGVGKSQLASAVAQALGWQFISISIQPRTEYQDLLWEFDAVARLAQAQMFGALKNEPTSEDMPLPKSLRREKFIVPGPLWWAIRPESAGAQNKTANCQNSPYLVKTPKNEGLVLLIDEIDKADANLPNGLLELLGNGDFGLPLKIDQDEKIRKPLTIITSNDERQLPPAFLRRCLVLTLKLPKKREDLIPYLSNYARAHSENGDESIKKVSIDIVKRVAGLICDLRDKCQAGERPPGAAEFLDLLRVVGGLGGGDAEMKKNIGELQQIVLLKEPLVLD